MARRLGSFEEIIDALASIGGGKFVTIGYICEVPINKTFKTVDKDAFGAALDADGDKGYTQGFRDFYDGKTKRGSIPFRGIIKTTVRQYNWRSQDSYKKAYAKSKEAEDDIYRKYGIYDRVKEIQGAQPKRSGYQTTMAYGNGVQTGDTENTRGNLYVNLIADSGALSEDYFVVDNEGNIIQDRMGKDNGILMSLRKSQSAKLSRAVLQACEEVNSKMDATRINVEELLKEVQGVGLRYTTLMYSRIMFIVATVNGEKIYYVNDKLTNKIGDKLEVSPADIEGIVKRNFEIASGKVDEHIRRRKGYIHEGAGRASWERGLRRLVEAKVDEAWYNNKGDFRRGVGKAVTAGTLGTAALAGGAYCVDKGLENQERYQRNVNREAARNHVGSDYHYERWCHDNDMDPGSRRAREIYDDYVEETLRESRLRRAVNKIAESVMRKLRGI